MGLPLTPPAVPAFLQVASVPLFDDTDCDRLLTGLGDDWVPARVTEYGAQRGAMRPDIRSVVHQRVPLDDDHWPLSAVRAAIMDANARRWRFDLTGFTTVDYPSVLLYEAGTMDHFSSHMDAGEYHPTRKLSFSVQLSDPADYRGGDLLFPNSGAGERARGVMTVFPSILLHEVTPVISGRRLALVGWVHGPTFR